MQEHLFAKREVTGGEGVENTGPSHRGWTMQNWNTTDQITRLENAGPENDKRNLINQTLQMK